MKVYNRRLENIIMLLDTNTMPTEPDEGCSSIDIENMVGRFDTPYKVALKRSARVWLKSRTFGIFSRTARHVQKVVTMIILRMTPVDGKQVFKDFYTPLNLVHSTLLPS